MIILYVPFTREQAGDLSYLVNLWQENHNHTSTLPLRIIYHNDNYDQGVVKSPSSIYICAHGYHNSILHVGNNSEFAEATRLDMATLGERFNNDFVPIAHKITLIHLYCCGDEKKNKTMAHLFKHYLLRPDCTIMFYNGALTIADAEGKQWSLGADKKTPVENSASFLFSGHDGDSEQSSERLSIKEQDKYEWRQNARLQRQQTFFARQKSRRTEFHSTLRDHYNP